uniref:collectin-10-like n=1 Tax=Styela clava TaxID=7725 RepID=UPI001939BE38|nr:collectin-10-like [Styela clava]
MGYCTVYLFLFLVCTDTLYMIQAGQQMEFCNQVCHYVGQHYENKDSNGSAAFDRVGKSGPRGPPGNVDYGIINATIMGKFEDLESNVERKLANIDFLEQKTDENIAEIQRIKAELQQMQSKINNMEELMTWHKFLNGYYYKVYHDKVNYRTARANCQRRNGNLASTGIRDSAIQSELMQLIKTSGEDIWIGLDDIVRENSFIWADGISSGSINWASNQPDNGGGAEDCVHYRPSYGWKLNDDPCSRTKKYICERRG